MYGLEDVTDNLAPVKSGDQKALERGYFGKNAAIAYQKHREEHRSAFMESVPEDDRNKYTYPAPDFTGEEEVVVSDAIVRETDPDIEKEPEQDDKESNNDSLAGVNEVFT
ncbi:hypothetical protein G7054_g11330 [Neopestalotiopsis clavispora]|nr:hypothetical protein G7054_g11330 [Neopestalotiopsis clavispora]